MSTKTFKYKSIICNLENSKQIQTILDAEGKDRWELVNFVKFKTKWYSKYADEYHFILKKFN